MKRNELLNSEVSYVVAKLGHFDSLTICDAGLPIPEEAQRIDLAVCKGVPSFLDTLKAVVSEMELESVEMAEEFKEESPELHQQVVDFLQTVAEKRGKPLEMNYITHTQFKVRTRNSMAVVRTGEFTPYANITLKSGVVF